MSTITGRMTVRDLVNNHHFAVETLAWYGVEVRSADMNKTLESLCRENDVNYWELKADLVDDDGPPQDTDEQLNRRSEFEGGDDFDEDEYGEYGDDYEGDEFDGEYDDDEYLDEDEDEDED